MENESRGQIRKKMNLMIFNIVMGFRIKAYNSFKSLIKRNYYFKYWK